MVPRSLLAVLAAAVALALPALALAGAPPDANVPAEALALLHDGRFGDAEVLLDGALARNPDDVAWAFLRSFATYWRLLYDPENDALASDFERRLDRTIDLADAALRSGRGDRGEIALWKGSSHLLLAQLRASQRKPLSAAFEAKKAKRLLEEAVEADSPPADSDFGIGTYQYYADQVPTLVKGLRVILFIPGGDRELGLARLERAARRSRYFALEARILLAVIYSDDRERLFDVALGHASTALEEHPDVLAVLHGVARLELGLGRPERARPHLDRALRLASERPGTDPSVVATLRVLALRAELESYRPDLAARHLDALRRSEATLPREVARGLGRLQARIDAVANPSEPEDSGDAERQRRAARTVTAAADDLDPERAGRHGESADRLDRRARADLEDPVAAFLAGRAALFARRFETAHAWLRRAEASPALPARFRGAARLYLGMVSDLLGSRQAALGWYERAAETERFGAGDALELYRSRPCSPADLPQPSAG